MKRVVILVATFALAAGMLLFPIVAEAAVNPFEQACNTPGGSASGAVACQPPTTTDPLTGPQGTISRVTGILSIVLGAVAVIFAIWGGIKYILANGDSSAISTAKSTIIYALVGIVVALLARPLINFVIGRIP